MFIVYIVLYNAIYIGFDYNFHFYLFIGYLVLAGRVRKEEERLTIIEVIHKNIKRKVDPHRLFTCKNLLYFVIKYNYMYNYYIIFYIYNYKYIKFVSKIKIYRIIQ